jgi:hypothetical protein
LKATKVLKSVPALLDSTAGERRNKSELRSFFSGTTRFSQILGNHRSRNAVVPVFTGAAVKARGQQRKLVGIRDGIAGCHMGEAMPASAGRQLPIARIGGEVVGRDILPGDLTRHVADAVGARARRAALIEVAQSRIRN